MKIENLLVLPEGKSLEFKENTLSKDKIIATVIAFANTSGGRIIVGVEDKSRNVVGVSSPYSEEERLSNIISDTVTPGLMFNVEIFPWRGTHILIIDVPMSSNRPHYIKQKGLDKSSYIRVGSTNRVADPLMIESIKRSISSKAFDEENCLDSTCLNLDMEAIKEAFEGLRIIKESDFLTLGIKNKRGDKKQPSNGGILFFGKNKDLFFPDAWIQVGCFQGVTKSIILDSLDIKDHFHRSVDQALNFVRRHIKVGLNIEGIVHEEQWEIPKRALREAILNSVIHADYSLRGSPLRIAIFDNRIEIDNPGLIPSGLTMEDIIGGLSKIRNRVISRIFRELKQTEQWGSGIGRIIDACQDHGLNPPKFEEVGDRFRVTIYRERVKTSVLNPFDRDILTFLTQSGPSSTKEISLALGYSERSVRPRLALLIESGKVLELARSHQDPKKKFMVIE